MRIGSKVEPSGLAPLRGQAEQKGPVREVKMEKPVLQEIRYYKPQTRKRLEIRATGMASRSGSV